MAKTRYRAEWCISIPPSEKSVDWDLDDIEYGSKHFPNRQPAIDHAHKHDLNNEGRVYVEEYHPFLDAEYGVVPHWDEVEEIYIFDDGTTETERIK